MGLFNKATELRMKDPVDGSLTVVGISSPDPTATQANYRLDGVVTAPGLEATAITHHGMTSVSHWPSPGQVLPVTVDRSHPDRLTIHWERLASSHDSARSAAEDLAASMRSGTTSPGPATAAPGGTASPDVAALLASLGLPADAAVTVTTSSTSDSVTVPEPVVVSAADVLARGTAATATLLEVIPDGTPAPDPDSVMLGLVLDVTLDARPAYPVANLCRVPRSRVAQLVVGTVLPVKVDPGQPMLVVVDWDRTGAPR